MTMPMPAGRDVRADLAVLQGLVGEAFRSFGASGGRLVNPDAAQLRVHINPAVRGGIRSWGNALHFSPRTAAELADYVRMRERDHSAVPSAAVVRGADELHRAMVIHHQGHDSPFAAALRAQPDNRRRFLQETPLRNAADANPAVTHRRQVAAAETMAAALANRNGRIGDPAAALQELAGLGNRAHVHGGLLFVGESGPLAERMNQLRSSRIPGDRERHDAYVAEMSAPLGSVFASSSRSGMGDPVEAGRLAALKGASEMREAQFGVAQREGLMTEREASRERASVNVRSAFKASLHLRGLAKLGAVKWLSTASFRYLGVHTGQGLASAGRGVANVTRTAGHGLGVRRDPERDRGVGDSYFAR